MYHIKNDKRSRTSAELIYESLISILDKKPYPKITITEVLEKSTVSRSTFYRTFDDLIDVLRMKCDQKFENYYATFILKYQDKQPEEKELIHFFFQYWYQNRDILLNIQKINRADLISDGFLRTCGLFESKFFPNFTYNTLAHEYYLAARSGEITGILLAWCRNKMQPAPNVMTDYLLEQIKYSRSNSFIC